MIVYHHLPSFIQFIKLLLTFLLLPTEKMSHIYSYRTFSRLVFLLRTVQAVGKKPKPQMVDISYRSFILESYI